MRRCPVFFPLLSRQERRRSDLVFIQVLIRVKCGFGRWRQFVEFSKKSLLSLFWSFLTLDDDRDILFQDENNFSFLCAISMPSFYFSFFLFHIVLFYDPAFTL